MKFRVLIETTSAEKAQRAARNIARGAVSTVIKRNKQRVREMEKDAKQAERLRRSVAKKDVSAMVKSYGKAAVDGASLRQVIDSLKSEDVSPDANAFLDWMSSRIDKLAKSDKAPRVFSSSRKSSSSQGGTRIVSVNKSMARAVSEHPFVKRLIDGGDKRVAKALQKLVVASTADLNQRTSDMSPWSPSTLRIGNNQTFQALKRFAIEIVRNEASRLRGIE